MKLRTLLAIAFAVTVAITAGMGVATWIVNGEVEQLAAESAAAEQIAHDITDLLVLTNELALHEEERPLIQWQALQRQIMTALQASPRKDTSAVVQLVAEASRLMGFLDQLADARSSPRNARHDMRVGLLLDQLLNHTQALSDSIHRWSEQIHTERLATDRRHHALALSMPVVLLLGLSGWLYVILRRVMQPLARLSDAMAAVAKGNLSVHSALEHDDEFGQVSRAFDALAIDLVSQLRQGEERLASALQTLRIANKVANLGVWVWDIRADTLVWDEGMFDIYGVPAEQRTPQVDYTFWSSRVHPQDLPMAETKLQLQIDGKGLYDPTFRVIRPDGSERFVQAAAFIERDASGTPTRMVGINSDITDRKRDELARAENERELETYREHLEHMVNARTAEVDAERSRTKLILDSSADGIISVDARGNIVLCNPAALSMLGYRLEDLQGHNVHDAIHYRHTDGKVYPADECIVIQAIRSGRPIRVDQDTFWDVDGNPVPVSVATHPIVEHGRTVGGVMNFQDISDRLKSEMAREDARLAAERLARMKSEFLANMSHEIRTPLNGVLGLAQVGYRDSIGRDKSHETFKGILDSGKLLLTIINDILDFSKIEAGKLDIETVPLDPAALADDVMRSVKFLAGKKGLQISIETSNLPSACLGDPVRISQIVLNLLSNAIKFTPAGEVRLRVSRDDAELVFEVTDTGIGIEPEIIARLFQPFEQADSTTTRKFGGTGLGLVISRRLAELMGGSLAVTSVPGERSTFTLRLPLQEIDHVFSHEAVPIMPTSRRLEGLHLLVAEDNEVNQIVMGELLRGEGADLLIVGNGQLAVDAVAAATTRFDAVLMDVQMPVLDGLEATRQLRQSHPGLPIIGQTAHALKEEHDRCRAAGMAATVNKPIDIEVLVSALLEITGAPRRQPITPGPAASSTGPTETAAVDWPALHKRYSNRLDFIDRLVALTVDKHAGDGERLRKLVAARDMIAIGELAHNLKGTGGNLCLPAVMDLAIRTMNCARADEEDALRYAAELATAVDQMIEAFRRGQPDD